jgi:isoleucyl-tRNA synthetase
MREIFDALCRLLAPILVFTADEAWRHSGATDSVHLAEFPEARGAGDDAIAAVNELLELRGVIGQAIEAARQQKVIGNALEAAVVLTTSSEAVRRFDREQLEEFFILSDLTIEQGRETKAQVSKTSHRKCARCWRHRAAVGQSAQHPELCDRCEAVVRSALRSA